MTALATELDNSDSQAQLELIKNIAAKGCSDDELKLILYTANKCGLDLLTQQIYAIKVWDSDKKQNIMRPFLGVNALRIIAQRTGEHEGYVGPFWYDKDMGWCDFWIDDNSPLAAKVGVYRKGHREPTWGIAKFATYVQKHKDKHTGEMVPTGFWAKGPEHMLAKVAESLALRRAFPNDLSGIYSIEEMSHVEVTSEEPIKLSSAELGPPPYKGLDHQKVLVMDAMKRMGVEDISEMKRINQELIAQGVPFKVTELEEAIKKLMKS